MMDKEEDEGRATDRIVEVGTVETVGLIYVWEDGSKQPLWFNGARQDVVAVSLCRSRYDSENTNC